MQQNIDPSLFKTTIATGAWQLRAGVIILILSLLAIIFGAGSVGAFGFAIGNALLFWGAMNQMFHALEAKLVLLVTSLLDQGIAAPAIPDDPEVQKEIQRLKKAKSD